MRGCKCFIEGMTIGLMSVAVLLMMKTNGSCGKKRKLKKSATKAMHAFGDIVDNVQNIVMP